MIFANSHLTLRQFLRSADKDGYTVATFHSVTIKETYKFFISCVDTVNRDRGSSLQMTQVQMLTMFECRTYPENQYVARYCNLSLKATSFLATVPVA
jgi:hypothetical protein